MGIDANNNIYVKSVEGIFISSDTGNTWIKTDLNGVNCLAFNINRDTFAGTSIGIFRSTDNGSNWTQLTQSSNYNINSIIINSKGQIYASTNDKGIYLSIDNGNTWEEYSQGISVPWISSLAINSKGYIFASTDDPFDPFVSNDLGVYHTTNSTTMVDEDIIKLPDNFELFQNYPNPFNSSTTIKFYLPFSAIINLKIYNITGKEVKALINNVLLNTGEHKISWNAKEFPSGIYFCRLAISNLDMRNHSQSRTTKLILLK